MQFNKSLLTATLLAAVSLTAVSANAAGTANGTFDVKLTVNSICSVATISGGGQDINLGTVNAGVGANGTSTTALSVNCSKGTAYKIALKPSGASTAGLGSLKGPGATTGSEAIPYKLTSDLAGATAWGSSEGTNTVAGTGKGMSSSQKNPHPVYATVDATATSDVTPGSYIDTVNVSVIY